MNDDLIKNALLKAALKITDEDINEMYSHTKNYFRRFNTPPNITRNSMSELNFTKLMEMDTIGEKQHNELTNKEFGHLEKNRQTNEAQSLYDYTDQSAGINHNILGTLTKKHYPKVYNDTTGDFRKVKTKREAKEILNKKSNDISRAIKHFVNPEGLHNDIHVYSGLGFDPRHVMKEGNIIHSPAFISTSIDPGKVESFLKKKSKYTISELDHGKIKSQISENHILHFHLPKGYKKGVYVAPISSFKFEREFTLDKNQHFKVIKHEVVNSVSNGGYYSKDINRRHIWTVVPHEEQVNERFEHKENLPFMWNTSSMSPASKKPLDDGYDSEHLMLSELHGNAADRHGAAIRRFTTASHFINSDLLHDKVGPMWKTTHENLQHLFTETKPLVRSHSVYGGLGPFNPEEHFNHSNGVFKIKSYISTSINPEIAIKHSNLKSIGDDSDQHIIHYVLPKGYTSGHYVSTVSPFKSEREMLLNAGQKFKLDKHTIYNIENNGVKKQRHLWSVSPIEDRIG